MHLFCTAAIPVTWLSTCPENMLPYSLSYLSYICLHWKEVTWNWSCLFCRSQLPVHFGRINITARDVRLCVCSRCCPTLCFNVVFPINCILYVCVLPLPSFPLSGAVCSTLAVCRLFVMLCHCSNQSVLSCWVFLFLSVSSSFLFPLVVPHFWLWFTSFLRGLLFKAVSLFVETYVQFAVFSLWLLLLSLRVFDSRLWWSAVSLMHHSLTPTQGQKISPYRKSELSSCTLGGFFGHLSLFC